MEDTTEMMNLSDKIKMSLKGGGSSSSNLNDAILTNLAERRFGYTPGQWSIKSLTTTVTKKYGLTTNGKFYSKKTRNVVNGFFDPSTGIVHIGVLFLSDHVHFTAITGHELIHGFHHELHPNDYDSPESERTAYRYSFDVYMTSGYFQDAFNTYKTALESGYWGDPSPTYPVPNSFNFPRRL